MVCGVKIIDNFLDKETFNNIKKILEEDMFPWYVSKGVTHINNTNKDHYAFFHKFYENNTINSNYFTNLKPILDKLNVKALIRTKANLYPKTYKIIEHNWHYDYSFPHQAALLMLNTNNGFTIMENKKKIKTKENRMLLFDASKLHKSTTCTDENFKINIVFNYF